MYDEGMMIVLKVLMLMLMPLVFLDVFIPTLRGRGARDEDKAEYKYEVAQG